MFSDRIENDRKNIVEPNEEEAKRALEHIDLEEDEVASRIALLWANGNTTGINEKEVHKKILLSSERKKRELYKENVFAIVPLYVTNECIESCKYCNYRCENVKGIERIRLSIDELRKEVEYLIEDKRLRTIELVYSSDPEIKVEGICDHIAVVKEGLKKNSGGCVGINIEAYDTVDYRKMVEAGLDFSVLWMETYDRDIYRQMHPGENKKANFEYRLNAYERMYNAGIKHIGLGILAGLADFRKDWAMLMLHQNYLRERYGKPVSILGIARLKPASKAPVKRTRFVPDDGLFCLAVAVNNIYSQSTLPFVNSREDWKLCERLARGGGCLFTFNCSTTPGGYTLGRLGNQFPTYDFDAPEFKKWLREDGFRPVFDWSFDSLYEIRDDSTSI